MTPLFADTFYYLALVNKDDASHTETVDFAEAMAAPTITTT
jgi:hypothetical protein